MKPKLFLFLLYGTAYRTVRKAHMCYGLEYGRLHWSQRRKREGQIFIP